MFFGQEAESARRSLIIISKLLRAFHFFPPPRHFNVLHVTPDMRI